MAQRNSNDSMDAFNRLFTPNTPCFYRPTSLEGRWYPTRTRSPAFYDELMGGVAVRIDGTSAPVLVTQLAMPGSSVFEEHQREADQVWENWVNDLVEVVADNEPVVADDTPVEEELAIYHYAISVATPRGEIHHDGTLQGRMIESNEDYLRYRAEMASDVGVTPEQIQVRSLAIIGVVPAPQGAGHE